MTQRVDMFPSQAEAVLLKVKGNLCCVGLAARLSSICMFLVYRSCWSLAKFIPNCLILSDGVAGVFHIFCMRSSVAIAQNNRGGGPVVSMRMPYAPSTTGV